MKDNEITAAVIAAAIKVHRALGPGLLESAYEACLEFELKRLGFFVERQQAVPLVYDGLQLDCGFRADLVVQRRVIVETKAKECLHPIDQAQLISHLRLLKLQVGLLINFHEIVLKDGIKRIVNNYRPDLELELELDVNRRGAADGAQARKQKASRF